MNNVPIQIVKKKGQLNNMIKFFKMRFEVFLLIIARKILNDRNVKRSLYISRKDNNKLLSLAEQIELIEIRMLRSYEE